VPYQFTFTCATLIAPQIAAGHLEWRFSEELGVRS